MIDFRLKEHRREAFIRYFVWQLRTTDCDPALAMMKYIFRRMEFNYEQKLWLSWLYGNTYHLPTAYLIWSEFPDYENVDQERLEDWNSRNFKRLRYQTDNKWQKGHLPAMFKSYRETVGSCQEDWFKTKMYTLGDDPKAAYTLLTKAVVTNFYKFGRYLTWFYLQTLKECCNLNLEPPDLLLGDSGSGSHRDGLCYVAGQDEWTSSFYPDGIKKVKRKVTYSPDVVQYLQSVADSILEEVKHRFPEVKPDFFLMETSLCSFKKLFRIKSGRYLGYYLDRQSEEISQVEEDGWDGVDWDLLWQYRQEELGLGRSVVSKEKMEHSYRTGQLPELSMFEDLR